jgi:hypothetical protein
MSNRSYPPLHYEALQRSRECRFSDSAALETAAQIN